MMNLSKTQYLNDKKKGKENNTYLLEKGRTEGASGQVSCAAVDGETAAAGANECQRRRAMPTESWVAMA